MMFSCLTCRRFAMPMFSGKAPLLVAALMTTAMLGGCATGAAKIAALSAGSQQFTPIDKSASPLDQAIQYWSQAFARNPGDPKAAVALARNLRAKGEKKKALAVLQRATIANSHSKEITSEYARVAVDLGQVEFAQKLIRRATDPNKPDWKLISAEGAAVAKAGKYKEAQGFFLRAMELKPGHPPLLNNLALAYALNGNVDDAEKLLRKAAISGRNTKKIRQNLALILGVQGKFDESNRVAAVQLNEGRAQSNTEFLKRWVKASPQTAPAPAQSVQVVENQSETLRGTNQPIALSPWSTSIQTADASLATEVADGH